VFFPNITKEKNKDELKKIKREIDNIAAKIKKAQA